MRGLVTRKNFSTKRAFSTQGDISMNTLQNLLDNGIDLITAQSMIENYSSKIGTRNGVYVITDITYDFEQRGKDVTLRCTKCGKEIHRMMIKGRNKWSELIKSCSCEKESKRKAELGIDYGA